GVWAAGGMGEVVSNAKELAGYLSFTQTHDMATGAGSAYTPLMIVSTLAWGLGYFGMPHILLRFMGTKSEEKLNLSRRVATVWVVISMAVAVLIGIVGYGVTATGQIEVLSGSDSETIVIRLAMMLSQHGIIAIIFAGIILAGILACTMSTADSQLLAASSSISQDIAQRLFGIKMSKKHEMWVARLTVIVIAIIAIFLARDPDSSVFGIVSFAWAGFGAAFGPVMLFALFWKRANKWGALSGMVAGGVMVFVWKFLVRPLGGIVDIYELLPAFVIGCVVLVVVSLLTAAPSEKVVSDFEAVRASAQTR
ncbi:MAG: sodium:proline symporter, partial [Clostridiales bacterium]|nr:sodium:proline symporter [Clostridiales bacterium]